VEVAENSGTVDYSVRLNTKPTNDVIVYVTSSDTNIATVSPSALTFSPTNWSTEQNITVTGVDDSVDNAGDSRMVTITHTPAGGGYAADQAASIQVWATDDDTAALVVTDKDGEELDSLTIADEHGGTGVYRVFLRTKPTSDVTVYVVSKDTNIATVSASSLTFSPTNWDSPQRVIVIAEPDDVANPGDSRSVDITNTASGSGYDAVVPKTVKVTVNNVKLADVDAAGLTVAPSTTTIDRLLITDEDGGTATYTVRLATNPTRNVTVYVVSTTPSVATASPLLLTFTPANWSKAQKVTVTGVDDDEDNTEDKRDVTITNTPSGYSGAAAVTVYVSVKDDDTQGLKLSRRSVTVGEAGGTSQYKVKLNAKPSRAVNVNVAETADSITVDRTTALEFDDVTWDDWQTVTVTGVDDDIDNLGNDRRATITNRIGSSCTANNAICEEVQVTILDDDEAGMEVAPTKLTVPDDGSTKTYVVKLNSEPRTGGTTLSVKLSGDKNAASVSPTTMSFTSSNWENGETFTVTGTEDTFDNTGRSQSLTITNTLSGGGYDDIQAVDVTVSVTDTEDKRDSELTLSKSSIEVTDKEDSKNDYTVRLKSKPTGNVTVTAEIAGTANIAMLHTADESTDTGFTAGSNSVTLTFTPTGDDAYNKAQTIRVTGVPDETDDAGDKFSSITHTVGASGVFIDDDNDDVSYSGNGKSISLRVKDDDKAGLKLSKRSLSTSEGEQETYTLVLTSQPTSAVIVDVVSSDPAVATVVPIRLIFNSTAVTPEGTCSNSYCWDAPQTVTVTGVNDGVDNARSRSVSITHTPRNDDSGYGDVDSKDVTVTVADGKKAAKLTIAPDIPLKMDEDGGTGIYSVKLNTEPTGYVTVEVESTNTNVAMVRPTLLTFTPTNWKDVQSITVTGVRSGKATITHDPDGGGYSGVRTASVAVEVLEDDSPGLRAPPQVVVAEGGTATYKVELKIRPSEAVTVTIKTNESIAMVAPSSLTFTPSNWNTPQPVTVTGVDDSSPGGSRSATITHMASGGGYDDVEVRVSVSVTDDDGMTVAPTAVEVAEAGGMATYRVSLNTQPTGTVTVAVASSDPAAATARPSSLTFTPSNWASQTVTVTGVNDDLDNGTSRLATITNTPSGAGYSSPVTVRVTVTDDEKAPTLEIRGGEATEGNTGTRTPLRFTVTKSGATDQVVTVAYEDARTGTATAGTDYTIAEGTLTFAPNETSKTLTVMVRGDDVSEPDETVVIALHNPSNARIAEGEGTATGTIVDDDASRLSIEASAVRVDEGEPLIFTITLDPPMDDQQVTVEVDTGGTATAGTDYMDVPETLTFAAGEAAKTITVEVVDDADYELDETVEVELRNPRPPGDVVIETGEAMVTIIDNDPQPMLSISGTSVAEGSDGTTSKLTFKVTKSGGTSMEATVAYADAGTGTATAGTDYTSVTAGTLTFAPKETAKTITVVVKGDDESEGDETVVIRLSSPSNATIAEGKRAAAGTIIDDDTLPRVATDWLARFGRTAAGATLDAIARRMNDGPAAEPSLTVAGHRASFAPEPVGQAAAATAAPWEEGWARALTIEELADGSSFDAGANFVEGLNVWAATSYNQFEMTPQGAYTMDGSLMSAILGVDYQADTHVVGLALAYHGGGGDFGGIGKTEGSLGTNLYSVHPYVRLTFGEAFHIGGSLGLGTGDLSITDTDGDALVETGVGMPVLAAVDARMELSLAEAWLLALQADGHLVQMVADERLPRFTRVETNTHRLRLVVENSYVFLVADGVSLAPVLETGLRYDGGDAVETGIGFDVGGGLRLDATVAAGLMVDARGHASLNNWGEGQEQAPTVRDWGLGGVIRWQPAGGGMGPEISLAPSYGGALGAAIPSLDATVGYRLPAFGGVLTPYSSADLAGGGRRSYSAGARFEVDPAVEVSAEGTYRQPTTGDIEQFLTLRVRLQQ
jgi:hypothetical protein